MQRHYQIAWVLAERAAAEGAVEIEEDLNEEDDEVEEENALATAKESSAEGQEEAAGVEVVWDGPAIKEDSGKSFYR